MAIGVLFLDVWKSIFAWDCLWVTLSLFTAQPCHSPTHSLTHSLTHSQHVTFVTVLTVIIAVIADCSKPNGVHLPSVFPPVSCYWKFRSFRIRYDERGNLATRKSWLYCLFVVAQGNHSHNILSMIPFIYWVVFIRKRKLLVLHSVWVNMTVFLFAGLGVFMCLLLGFRFVGCNRTPSSALLQCCKGMSLCNGYIIQWMIYCTQKEFRLITWWWLVVAAMYRARR